MRYAEFPYVTRKACLDANKELASVCQICPFARLCEGCPVAEARRILNDLQVQATWAETGVSNALAKRQIGEGRRQFAVIEGGKQRATEYQRAGSEPHSGEA